MAGRIRTIKPEWLEDEKMVLASPAARAMSIALILLADDHGRGVGNRDLVVSRTFPAHHREGHQAFDELVELGFLTLYLVRGQTYFEIRNWAKHQRVDKPGKPRVPPPSDGVEIIPETLAKVPGSLAPDHDHDHDHDRDHDSSQTRRGGDPPPAEALELASALANAIAERQPGSKPAQDPGRCAKRWAVDIDKLHRLDKRPWGRIREVLDWSQNDPFWQSNILSGKKLREQFDQLEARMGQPRTSPQATNRGLTAADLWRMSEEAG